VDFTTAWSGGAFLLERTTCGMTISTSSKKTPRHYPTQLELFHQCRRRYLLKVVERRAVSEPFSPALAKGIAAHDVLKVCGNELRATASVPADLRPLVKARLSIREYLTDLSWSHDVDEVVEWIKFGLSHIDPYATILGVELFLDRTFRPDSGSAPLALGIVVDLLLLRTDETGERFLEVIDYKTGKRMEDQTFAPVMARFALKRIIDRHLPGVAFPSVVFTELYLAQGAVRSQELTFPTVLAKWEEVNSTISAITSEKAWAPKPSPLCRWCPFNGNGCTPESAEDSGDLW
jgi:hypothetical protein